MAQLLGPDVSGYQPGNIFDSLDPLDFGFVKATEGLDYVSGEADQQITSLINRGKRFGFYHFLSGDDPNRQADYFCSQTEGYFGKGIPIADFEASAISALGGAGLLAFAKRVESNHGVKPLVYMSLSVAERSDMSQVVANDNGLWVAYGSDYTDQHNGWTNVPADSESGVWPFAIARQFTDNLHLTGYSGGIDGNVFYGDTSVFDAYAGGKANPNPNPTPPSPPSGNIPAYPLPDGWWIGPEAGPQNQVSGLHGHSDAVRAFQQRLKDRGWDLTVDGLYGFAGDTSWSQSETGKIIHAYQAQKGLVADGLGGINTWNSIWRDPIT